MRHTNTAGRVLLIVLFTLATHGLLSKEAFEPPVAKKIPKAMTLHGDTRVDNYYWMRERENPEVKAYLAAENIYADAMMKPTEPLQEKLYNEMLSHMKETDLSVPYRDGNYFYYSRTEQGKQYQMLCRKKGSLDSPEEIILDVNELGKGQPYIGLGATRVSWDGNLLAYATDNTGYRDYVLHVKDLRTGKLLSERIERARSLAWAADNKTLFYITTDPAKRAYRLYRHVVGTSEYELLYEEKDEKYSLGVNTSSDREYIWIGSSSSTTSEYRYVPTAHPAEFPTLLLPRESDHEYYPDHANGKLYLVTNKNVKNFRVVTAPIQDPVQNNWTDFIPYQAQVTVEDVAFFKNHCVVSEREMGLPWLRVIDLRTGASHRVEMPEPVFSVYLLANLVFDTNIVRFGYESMVTPASIIDYDMDTRKKTVLKQREVPGGFDAANYRSERIYATATDGVKVPISLVYRVGVQKNGTAPLLLEGYGAYGAPSDIYFSSGMLVLLDRGVIYAMAHIRGGGDLGEEWYEQGKLMKKKNTFTDYIACAEHLITQKYTSADRLTATGASAGGLLMGAVMNMRPDLFKAALIYVPYVDAVTTMLDPTIPLVTPEYLEWGNPNEKEAYFYMKSYCPYTNISAQSYPAMLVRTSFWDSQVQYWEPAKYVAKLRANKTDHNLLLLKTALEAGGHGGASGRYDSLHDDAFDYAFLLTQVGVKEPATASAGK